MASWKTTAPQSGFDTNEYLLVAVKTIDELGWTLHFVSDHGLIAGVPLSVNSDSYGETITIWFTDNNINVESRSNKFVVATKKNQHNVEQYLNLFNEMQYRINSNEQTTLLTWLSGVKSAGEKDVLDPASPAYIDPEKPKRWYQPKKEFFITPLLIGVCVVLFGLMVVTGGDILNPSIESLIRWGANARFLTVIEGQWWRIITCVFEHVGILHLGMNMIGIYTIGIILEPMIGKWRMLAAFLVTGVGGSIASLLWNPDVVSAGASGAIFGLFGLLLALLTTNLMEKRIRKSILPNLLIVIGLNLAIGFAPGIDYAAHIGGLLTGLVLGYIYYLFIKGMKQSVPFSILVTVLLGTGIAVAGLRSMNDSTAAYTRIVNVALDYEKKAVERTKIIEDKSDVDIPLYVRDTVLPAWTQFQQQLGKLSQLKLPPDLEKSRKLLNEYAVLRIKYFELVLRASKEKTDAYDEEMNNTMANIETIIEALNKMNEKKAP